MSEPARLRIGIDFDGTLADSIGAAARYLRDLEGIELEPEEMRWPPGRERIGAKRFAAMIKDPRFFQRLEFVPGAEATMRTLGRDADLYIVTARTPEQAEPVERWLQHHELEVNGVATTSYESKVAACRKLQLDLHLDDMLAHTADLMHETETVLALLAAPWNDLRPSGPAENNGPRIHADWHAFHDWVHRTFEHRLRAN
ncbi:MAG: hypothetical protein O3A10_06470 [Chloroflexi bacterium]|nr:hypothetical protein [Chloroflexota bacterium]MDA1145033.1 hypothetical protein [Chloroflexota bacterium]MQC82918.1 hypothetical protein [Chloroflexota bacterium]